MLTATVRHTMDTCQGVLDNATLTHPISKVTPAGWQSEHVSMRASYRSTAVWTTSGGMVHNWCTGLALQMEQNSPTYAGRRVSSHCVDRYTHSGQTDTAERSTGAPSRLPSSQYSTNKSIECESRAVEAVEHMYALGGALDGVRRHLAGVTDFRPFLHHFCTIWPETHRFECNARIGQRWLHPCDWILPSPCDWGRNGRPRGWRVEALWIDKVGTISPEASQRAMFNGVYYVCSVFVCVCGVLCVTRRCSGVQSSRVASHSLSTLHEQGGRHTSQ